MVKFNLSIVFYDGDGGKIIGYKDFRFRMCKLQEAGSQCKKHSVKSGKNYNLGQFHNGEKCDNIILIRHLKYRGE